MLALRRLAFLLAELSDREVAGSYEETCWMTKHISIPFLVYHQSEMADVAHTYMAGAHEAGGYLRFIAEYYDCLPEVWPYTAQHQQMAACRSC